MVERISIVMELQRKVRDGYFQKREKKQIKLEIKTEYEQAECIILLKKKKRKKKEQTEREKMRKKESERQKNQIISSSAKEIN